MEFQEDISTIGAIEAIPTILNVVCRVTGMGFAAVARVTPERWVCLAVNDEIAFGLKPGGELKVDTTICHEVRQAREAVVIDHVAEDTVYCGHPTPRMYGFQSYISMPIFLKNGNFYGTLCAIDPNPAKINNEGVVGMFRLFADLIAIHLEAAGRIARAEESLSDAQATAVLRDQFIAVLGHDLRNPVTSIGAGIRLLRKTGLNEKAQSIVNLMDSSVARMAALIENVMDFARGQLGGGITVRRVPEDIKPVLGHVIDELQLMHPDRSIESEIEVPELVSVDRDRIGRLFSNLLKNALNYSPPGSPVRVRASTHDGFELSVSNEGPSIPPSTLKRLFSPFARGDINSPQQGLGLGLYIVLEIARAHGGTIEATSDERETRFTFKMPPAGST